MSKFIAETNKEIKFNGLTKLEEKYVWTDGVNYYYTYSYKILSSYMYSNAILKNGVWVNAAACGDMIGLNVWTDDVDYYSDGSKNWILNPKAMKG